MRRGRWQVQAEEAGLVRGEEGVVAVAERVVRACEGRPVVGAEEHCAGKRAGDEPAERPQPAPGGVQSEDDDDRRRLVFGEEPEPCNEARGEYGSRPTRARTRRSRTRRWGGGRSLWRRPVLRACRARRSRARTRPFPARALRPPGRPGTHRRETPARRSAPARPRVCGSRRPLPGRRQPERLDDRDAESAEPRRLVGVELPAVTRAVALSAGSRRRRRGAGRERAPG